MNLRVAPAVPGTTPLEWTCGSIALHLVAASVAVATDLEVSIGTIPIAVSSVEVVGGDARSSTTDHDASYVRLAIRHGRAAEHRGRDRIALSAATFVSIPADDWLPSDDDASRWEGAAGIEVLASVPLASLTGHGPASRLLPVLEAGVSATLIGVREVLTRTMRLRGVHGLSAQLRVARGGLSVFAGGTWWINRPRVRGFVPRGGGLVDSEDVSLGRGVWRVGVSSHL